MRPLAALLFLLACRRAPVQEPFPPSEPPANEAPSAFVYRGWPGEGIPDVVALRATTLELHGDPGGETAGSCALAEGEPLSYSASVVRTERPAPVALAEPHELPEGSIAYGGLDTLDLAAAQGTSVAGRTLVPGAAIVHLQYRAEGWCLYRIEEDVVETPCFHDPARSAETSWWLEASCAGASGWVRVDGRDDLRIGRRF